MRTNCDYFPIQRWAACFYNWERGCLMCGTSSISYVIKVHPLKPSGHYMYHQFNILQSYILHTRVYSCVLCWSQSSDYFSLQHQLIGFYNRSSVYCAVLTGSLNQTDTVSSLKGYHTHDKKPTNQNPATGPPHDVLRKINNLRPSEENGLPSQRRFSWNSQCPTAWCASPLVPIFTQIWQWMWRVWAEI
jgi:hypothetical protein